MLIIWLFFETYLEFSLLRFSNAGLKWSLSTRKPFKINVIKWKKKQSWKGNVWKYLFILPINSNINEVIRAVLNLLIFFYEKISHASKAQKSNKSTKSTKRHKDTQAKAQHLNKRINDYFPLRCFLGAFFIFVHLQAFCAFLCSWNFWIKKSKFALITSFILLLNTVVDTDFSF